ncbi:MAG: SDR family NAD(P)-dependent oxidoreductase [Scytonematopsis contorta HA4267-MV1]|nr:SDR family NAD(P)-dependent oxidoreductase [Scytonematopsis contorta HA4267-MV1]
MKLEDVRAIVTGAASGIGRCIAIELARAGALVVAGDIDSEMIAKIPLGRMAKPYEIWLAMRFIIECDYFTASTIEVDGGAMF